jgi:segregation and condensation protein B
VQTAAGKKPNSRAIDAGLEENLEENSAGNDIIVRLSRLEAILFLAREPLSSRKLAQLAHLADGTKARTLVRALNQRYDSEESAFRVEEIAGGFRLLTRPRYAPWLRRLHGSQTEVRLSAPTMETLAVVAYRQPLLRAEIEAIRGVQSGEILRQLIERNLVRIVGRSEELGRPLLYGTTRHFLQVFGLRHLEDLPRIDFLPITNRAEAPAALADQAAAHLAEPNSLDLNAIHHSPDTLEETEMSITIQKKVMPEGIETPGYDALNSTETLGRTTRFGARLSDEEEEEDVAEEEEDEPWEEVDDEEDEEEDWEDDDDDWDDEEDVDEGEDWEDDDDDDWEDDDEEEEDEDEE